VTDWSSGEAKVIELPLDPARSAREQVLALFKKARRIKRGVAVARERQSQAEARRDVLVRLSAEARGAQAHDALEEVVRRARAAAPGDFVHDTEAAARAPGAARPVQARRKAYRTFRASTGARILVGRGGADNDELTLHVARPHDLWLHARGHPGAHVVVRLDKGHSCPPEVLVDAAHLAAHFSDARGELVVEVEHTDRRFVRKPRGSAPGLVVVQREKVLTLRLDPSRLAALVASETDGSEP
jgi:predicted ribosome quality control (RQC) complex YloA/Tae2 family protein